MPQNQDIDIWKLETLVNCLFQSRLLGGYHTLHSTRLVMSKVLVVYKPFLRSMLTNSFKRINISALKENDSASEPRDWHHKITMCFPKTQKTIKKTHHLNIFKSYNKNK